MSQSVSEGRKNDDGKLRFDLIPPRPLEKVAEVYTIGAKKYADRNWEKGIKWGRVFAALMRHAWAWWRGEKFDQTDGQHHLAAVAWCALTLMEYEETRPEFDDRPAGGEEATEAGRPEADGRITSYSARSLAERLERDAQLRRLRYGGVEHTGDSVLPSLSEDGDSRPAVVRSRVLASNLRYLDARTLPTERTLEVIKRGYGGGYGRKEGE